MSVKTLAKQLSRQRGTQARRPSRRSPARYSFRMTTHRNRSIPLGKAPSLPPIRKPPERRALGIGNDSSEQDAISFGVASAVLSIDPGGRNGQLSACAWKSSSPLLGNHRSEFNRKRLSAVKGTRETQPSMAITRAGRLATVMLSPMRRLGVGAFVVVRGRESRPHGEGRQYVSLWMTERFCNREGFR